MLLQTGQILNNRYRIVRLLGQGGFGAVYKAWDLRRNFPCAVKENLDSSPHAQRQFHQEAQILSNLSHPNLPAVTDSFSIPNLGQYLVMDYVEGYDLEQLLQQGVLDIRQIENAIAQICQALIYLHQQNPPIIHRDIKPANIIITPQGKAILVDFGIAKIYDPRLSTITGAKAASPGYSPPEQYGFGKTDIRSDVYSLGATMYALLTGRQPPDAIALVSGSTQLYSAQFYNPAVSAQLSQLVAKAMSIRPIDRCQSVNEFYQGLINHRRTTTYLPVSAPQPASWSTFIMGSLGFISLLILLIASFALFGSMINQLTISSSPTSLSSLVTFTPVTPTLEVILEATATDANLLTPVISTDIPTLSFIATVITSLPTKTHTPRPTSTPQPSVTPSRTPTATARPSSTPVPTATLPPSPTNTATLPPPTVAPPPTATFPPPPTSTPLPTNTLPPPPTNTPAPTNTLTFQGNVAPLSNRNPDGEGSGNAFDGNLATFWGLGHHFSLTLNWGNVGNVTRILVWDRPQNSPDNNQINKLDIILSNGISKTFDMISGGPRCIDASLSPSQFINSVTLTVSDGSGHNGLSEVEIWIGPKTTSLSCSNYGTIP